MGKVLLLDRRRPDPDVVQAAAAVVQGGGVVLSPTDTVYGLACDPWNCEAVGRIREMKGRSVEKGFLLLIPGLDWVTSLVGTVPRDSQQLMSLWPGPVTLLFVCGPGTPAGVVGSQQKIGLRCPQDSFLQSWLGTLTRPVLSTSANQSGKEMPATAAALREMFEDSVDLLLLAPENIQAQASTVVDLTISPPRIVRRGEWANRVEARLAGPS